MRFRNKTAVVTGSSGSIGSAVAKALAAEGADVALIDIRPSTETAADIEGLGRRAVDLPADISNAEAASAAIAGAVETLGGIDVLVNAAGITSWGSAADLAEAEWDRVLAINLKGVFLCCQAAIAPLRCRGGGRIVNIGSILGKNGGNARPWLDPAEQARSGNIAYGISKAGVHMLTIYLARELASSRITVNAVAPGPVASAMTRTFPDSLKALIPLGRMGEAHEVASAVLYLASDEAAFITGEILDVNGGSWSD
jgi:NAD(P)-dependent dehydrogenase (short-subunit alcohol dehydrogenase family)